MKKKTASRFHEKVALVTGAASGLGLEFTKQLLEAGALVTAVDCDAEALRKETAALEAGEGRLVCRTADVTDEGALREVVAEVVRRHERLDIMLNNAGIAGRIGEISTLDSCDWERVFRINVLALIHGSTLAYHQMLKQGDGQIVNMASAAGLLPTPSMAAYGSSKAAVIAFSQDLRLEAEARGISVTTLCPGFIESRIIENSDLRGRDPLLMKAAVPVRFLPTEVAVQKMLVGIANKEALVLFPRYVAILWILRRLFTKKLDDWIGSRVMAACREKG